MIALTASERARLIGAGIIKLPSCSRASRASALCSSESCRRTPAPGRRSCEYHLAQRRRYNIAAQLKKKAAKA
jgi:hypothetical protein